jgi:hypothetical protein
LPADFRDDPVPFFAVERTGSPCHTALALARPAGGITQKEQM